MERRVEAHGLQPAVRLLPPQRHEMLSSYYRAADACVVPSHSESFGLVALEAAACGVPVVAAAVGGLTTLVDDGRTGYLVEGRDPADFARPLAAILADPGLAARLGRAGAAPGRGLHLGRGRPGVVGPRGGPDVGGAGGLRVAADRSPPTLSRWCPARCASLAGAGGRRYSRQCRRPEGVCGSRSFGEVRTAARPRCSGGGTGGAAGMDARGWRLPGGDPGSPGRR